VGSQIAGMTVMRPDQARCEETTAPGWRPFRQPLVLADDGRFLLDHFLGRFCNPFYRINSEAELYDKTVDRFTGEPLSLADFKALECGTEAPDELQRELGSFLAGSLIDDCEKDLCCLAADPSAGPRDVSVAFLQAQQIRTLNPFRPLLSPELERHLMQIAAARCGREIPSSVLEPTVIASVPEQPPIPRPGSEHEKRFRQRIENLRALRNISVRNRENRHYSVLIVGAGPAGLIRAISATLQGLKTVVLELRPEDGPKRPQIVVIRSQAVIALLDQLGVVDFLFKETRIFPFGQLQLEVSLADLELAFEAILRFVTADEQDQIVQRGTFIERIDQEQGLARVTARKSDQQTLLSFSPQLIVIADGKRSPTSAVLGITRRDRFHSHTGIIAIFRAEGRGLSQWRRMLGELASKLNYAFHRYVSRRGIKLVAGTILQVPGHHYLGLDLAPDEEMRLRNAITRTGDVDFGAEGVSPNGSKSPTERAEFRRLLRFWAKYAFEAIRTQPKGSAPHTGGRPIHWLPLDPQLAMPIEVVTDRADVFCGHIGETFVMIEGDAQFTIHPGSAYGCAKAFLSARLFDFLLRARLSRPDGRGGRLAERVFFCNSELMARECKKITRFFRVTA
jgi:hypothetical protein